MACGGLLSGFLCLLGIVVAFKVVRYLVRRGRGPCGGGGSGRSCGGWGGWRGRGPCGGGGEHGDSYDDYDGYAGYHAHGDDPRDDAHAEHPYRGSGSGSGADSDIPWRDVTGRGGWRRRRAWRRGVGVVAARIGASREQRDVMEAAADELRAAFDEHKGELAYTRKELASALRDPDFDATRMGELFAHHDTALDTLRKALVGSLASVHDTLSVEQRERLSKIISR